MANEASTHYLISALTDAPLGETTEDLKVGDTITLGGTLYKVVDDSGTSRPYHEIYLARA